MSLLNRTVAFIGRFLLNAANLSPELQIPTPPAISTRTDRGRCSGGCGAMEMSVREAVPKTNAGTLLRSGYDRFPMNTSTASKPLTVQ
jgi:hypothetical protein